MPHSKSQDIPMLDLIFTKARTHRTWEKKCVEKALLEEIYNLAKLGPTSANCCPLRVVFIESVKAKEKLKGCLDSGNIEKTMAAPVTAIFALDMKFYMQKGLGLNEAMREYFTKDPNFTYENAFRNASLQAAYFMLAARAKGLDCGPMSGFSREKVDSLFFQGSSYKSDFLCNLGYGKKEELRDRKPRLSFDEVCKLI